MEKVHTKDAYLEIILRKDDVELTFPPGFHVLEKITTQKRQRKCRSQNLEHSRGLGTIYAHVHEIPWSREI